VLLLEKVFTLAFEKRAKMKIFDEIIFLHCTKECVGDGNKLHNFLHLLHK
jgi:hypothetical protein